MFYALQVKDHTGSLWSWFTLAVFFSGFFPKIITSIFSQMHLLVSHLKKTSEIVSNFSIQFVGSNCFIEPCSQIGFSM